MSSISSMSSNSSNTDNNLTSNNNNNDNNDNKDKNNEQKLENLKKFDLLEINKDININTDENLVNFLIKYEQWKKCSFVKQTFKDSVHFWKINTEEKSLDSIYNKKDTIFKNNSLFDLIKRKMEYILHLTQKNLLKSKDYLQIQKYSPIINLQINDMKNIIYSNNLKYFLKNEILMNDIKNDYLSKKHSKTNLNELYGITYDPFYNIIISLVYIYVDKKYYICLKSLDPKKKIKKELRTNRQEKRNRIFGEFKNIEPNGYCVEIEFEQGEKNTTEEIQNTGRYKKTDFIHSDEKIISFKMNKFYNHIIIAVISTSYGVGSGATNTNRIKIIKINYNQDKVLKMELIKEIYTEKEVGEKSKMCIDELHISSKNKSSVISSALSSIYSSTSSSESKNDTENWIFVTFKDILYYFKVGDKKKDSINTVSIDGFSNFNINQKTNQLFLIYEDNSGNYKPGILKINTISDLNIGNYYTSSISKLFKKNISKNNLPKKLELLIYKSYLFENYTLIYEEEKKKGEDGIVKIKKIYLYRDNYLSYELNISKAGMFENLFLTRTKENELMIIIINCRNIFIFLFNEEDKQLHLKQNIYVKTHFNNYKLEYRLDETKKVERDFLYYEEDTKTLYRNFENTLNSRLKVKDEKNIFTDYYEDLIIEKSYFDHYSKKIFLHIQPSGRLTVLEKVKICVLDLINM